MQESVKKSLNFGHRKVTSVKLFQIIIQSVRLFVLRVFGKESLQCIVITMSTN